MADLDWLVPWFPGSLMQTLAADADYMTAAHNRLSSRALRDVSVPYSTVQVITNPPINDRHAAWRPTLQLYGWCPPMDSGEDPALIAWGIATAGIRAVLRAPKWSYDGWHGMWSVVLGPVEDIDITRGPDAPVYGARVHIESTAKHGD
jgi:hypothetical protein